MLNPEHAQTFCRGALCALLSKLLLFPSNRSFLSYKNSHFQNKAKCKTFLVYLNFICMRISLKKFISKKFQVHNANGLFAGGIANLLKHFKRGRRVCMYIACSRRSDSGERCEVKRSAKNKSEGGGEVFPHLSPQSPSTFHRFLYFAPLSTI